MEISVLLLALLLVLVSEWSAFRIGGRVWRHEQTAGGYQVYMFKHRRTSKLVDRPLFPVSLWSMRLALGMVTFFFASLAYSFVRGAS